MEYHRAVRVCYTAGLNSSLCARRCLLGKLVGLLEGGAEVTLLEKKSSWKKVPMLFTLLPWYN